MEFCQADVVRLALLLGQIREHFPHLIWVFDVFQHKFWVAFVAAVKRDCANLEDFVDDRLVQRNVANSVNVQLVNRGREKAHIQEKFHPCGVFFHQNISCERKRQAKIMFTVLPKQLCAFAIFFFDVCHIAPPNFLRDCKKQI